MFILYLPLLILKQYVLFLKDSGNFVIEIWRLFALYTKQLILEVFLGNLFCLDNKIMILWTVAWARAGCFGRDIDLKIEFIDIRRMSTADFFMNILLHVKITLYLYTLWPKRSLILKMHPWHYFSIFEIISYEILNISNSQDFSLLSNRMWKVLNKKICSNWFTI